MKLISWVIVLTSVSTHVAHVATNNTSPIGYKWSVDLKGPTEKCKVPKRINFVVSDAIIGGEIMFAGVTYFPQGRFEDSRQVELSLVRFYGDKKPLLSLTTSADGNWNGTWTSQKQGCSGQLRVLPR